MTTATTLPKPRAALPVEERIARIVALLAGTADPTGDFFAGKEVTPNPFGVPDWYPPDLDPDVQVLVGETTGLRAGRDLTTYRHNGIGPVTVPPPRDPNEYNLLRLRRHKVLLGVYEGAVRAMHEQERFASAAEIGLVLVNVPFRWDARFYGPAPTDECGNLMPGPARRRLEELRDYHGDMYFAIEQYLREHRHVEVERRIIY